jgi:Tfp pilus assembly protein PilV
VPGLKGFFLLEVTLSLFLFSACCLFLLQQQVRYKQQINQIYYRHIALQQSLSLLERFKANTDWRYRELELLDWNKVNAFLLPQGVGVVNLRSTNCQIKICWHTIRQTCFCFPA